MIKKILLLATLIFAPIHPQTLDQKKLLSTMTLEEKAAQLVFIALAAHEEKEQAVMEGFKKWAGYDLHHAHAKKMIREHKVGGVIFYGYKTSAAELEMLIKELQDLSTVPLLVTLDAETGLHNRLDPKSVVSFPQAMTLGAIADTQLIYKHGNELGEQLRRIGVHWTFSPVADVNCNPANPVIGRRSFSSDQEWVAEHAIAFMQGLQDARIIACAKHFPGHGDTAEDSHEVLPIIRHSIHRLEYVELYPFQKLIDAGIKSIMLAHLEVPAVEKKRGVPSSLSYSIGTSLLKEKMGFTGLVVTDCMGMKGVTNHVSDEEMGIRALEAGNHVILCPPKPEHTIAGIVKAVKSGRMSEKKLDEIVLKVLEAKAWVLDKEPDKRSLDYVLHSKKAYELKRELFTRSITIAKADKENSFKDATETTLALTIGEKTERFESALEHFGIAHYPITSDCIQEDNWETKAPWIAVKNELKKRDHVIVSIHSRIVADTTLRQNASHDTLSLTAVTHFIQKLKELNKTVTLTIFGSPYLAAYFQAADTIIIAYENVPEAQEPAVEVICGKQKAEGRMPI